jgi:hypothetical protein
VAHSKGSTSWDTPNVEVPPRDVTDQYLASMNKHLEIVCDIDLGELVEGHHVVVRGIRFGDPKIETEAELHYEFVPGLLKSERESKGPFFWLWTLQCCDDVNTDYNGNNSGVFDPNSGGSASHGSRDLGARIPHEASRLTIEFEPPRGWNPVGSWRNQIVVDIKERRLL